MLFSQDKKTMQSVAWGNAKTALVTVYSRNAPVRSMRAEFLKVWMVAITLATDECAEFGDLIVCSPPFASGLSVEGLFQVSHCRRADEPGKWIISAELLALQPTETMIRWYFEERKTAEPASSSTAEGK